MANQLDLEEQEQLDELKHFWKQYGDLITWVLIAVLGTFAAWNGYQYWQRTQSAKASALYEEVERAAQANDVTRTERAFGDIQSGFGGTVYAHRAGLLAAKVYYDANKTDAAKAALTWVADKAGDEGFAAVANLRLAGVLADAKAYDEALKILGGKFPAAFDALLADRKGDIFSLQGKAAEAKAEYSKAYAAFSPSSDYRKLVEFNLNAMGVDVAKDDKSVTAVAATDSRK